MSDHRDQQAARDETTGAAHPVPAAAWVARPPGPGAPPAGRPGWATGEVPFPALVGALVAAFAASLGLAAAGGWGGLVACALIVLAMISVVVVWAE